MHTRARRRRRPLAGISSSADINRPGPVPARRELRFRATPPRVRGRTAGAAIATAGGYVGEGHAGMATELARLQRHVWTGPAGWVTPCNDAAQRRNKRRTRGRRSQGPRPRPAARRTRVEEHCHPAYPAPVQRTQLAARPTMGLAGSRLHLGVLSRPCAVRPRVRALPTYGTAVRPVRSVGAHGRMHLTRSGPGRARSRVGTVGWLVRALAWALLVGSRSRVGSRLRCMPVLVTRRATIVHGQISPCRHTVLSWLARGTGGRICRRLRHAHTGYVRGYVQYRSIVGSRPQ